MLAEEVISGIRSLISASSGYVPLTAGATREADIWGLCSQFPAPGERRLVLVRDAHRLKNWQPLADIAELGREMTGSWLVFVSPEETYSRKTGDGSELLPGPAIVQASSSGQIVKCSMSDADRLDWVTSLFPHVPNAARLARHLLSRAGGDLLTCRTVTQYLALFPHLPPSEAMVDTLCQPQAADEFADLLVLGRRSQALLATPEPADLGKVIGLLASRLDTMSLLHAGQEMGMRELVTKLGVPQFLAARFRPVASSYQPSLVRQRRRLLAIVDQAWRNGAREGIPEVLAALW